MFSSQLSLPQPLDPRSPQAFTMFPWRAFLEDSGPFPVMSSIPNTLEYDMQMCLCGLSDRDRKVAHGELVGVQALLEDVLLSGSHVIVEGSSERQATRDNTQPDWSKHLGLCPSRLESHAKASALLEAPCEAAMPLALLKSFLVLWKQLETLKEHWGRLKLQGQEVNSASLHRQFSELYKADIFYPSMKALARRVGKEDEFEELIIRSQSILPPKGVSEMEIKAQQVHRALFSLPLRSCLATLVCKTTINTNGVLFQQGRGTLKGVGDLSKQRSTPKCLHFVRLGSCFHCPQTHMLHHRKHN